MKAFSDACERNKEPILAVLRHALQGAAEVLEVGSGTGQHAAFFAAHLPHLRWQPSDVDPQRDSVLGWARELNAVNVAPPLALDVNRFPWPVAEADAVFSANTAHIMSWTGVTHLFRGVAEVLQAGGPLCLYGPMNYGGRYTSDSNARFDQWLKRRDPASGIRDFAALDELATRAGLSLERDYPMPANNRLIVWRRPPPGACEGPPT